MLPVYPRYAADSRQRLGAALAANTRDFSLWAEPTFPSVLRIMP
jgi:hypothetical protein